MFMVAVEEAAEEVAVCLVAEEEEAVVEAVKWMKDCK